MANGEQLDLSLRDRLLNELSNVAYRRAFVEGHSRDTIAFQLRMLRKARGWEQGDVAEKLGNRRLQPMISRYENPNYGKYSISTLLELAAVFDVALIVRLAPFSELLEWDWKSNAATLCPPRFDEDDGLVRIAAEIHAAANEQARNRQQSPSLLTLVLDSMSANAPASAHSRQGHSRLGTLAPADGGAARAVRVA